ncbi:MAG: phosphoenolpyruvate carboxykinase [Candidatus Eremiobacteraeota bacterium]|nr:phosphoenolpyruvate carboxykinase [Candidatus Eremiobacteraeota bacterium]
MSLGKVIFKNKKCIMRSEGSICKKTRELLASELFAEVTARFIEHLRKHDSPLMAVFDGKEADKEMIDCLVDTLGMLGVVSADKVAAMSPETAIFLKNPELLNDFVEGLYNYWRNFDRFLICRSRKRKRDVKGASPYRVFNEAMGKFTRTVRGAYRDVQENITDRHCRIYRQVSAGSQVGLIEVEVEWPCPKGPYNMLRSIPMIRQVLLNPPLIIDPPMNKRTGRFQKVETNPLEGWNVETDEWLCYPARVGPLLVHIYFNQTFLELGCSLANLFELAEADDLDKKPDAICMYGVPGETLYRYGPLPTVFYDDTENEILVGAIPGKLEFGYFGYLKKMVLTLHNIVMMKRERMPCHGAMVHVLLKNGRKATVLLIGDTAAGKSETLEALRVLSDEYIRDMIIIADDMGSLEIDPDGGILGYGTETGAFVRLDDLQPGYAFGQIDRAIIMSPQRINARAIIPVTTLANISRGYQIDFLLYANNYEEVDEDHPVVERFHSIDDAIRVFREGMVMAKGTTTSTGIVHTYFANIFGPPQYRDLHDHLASKHFQAAFDRGVFVGQIRTRLGISGWETRGPEEGAKTLFNIISSL